MALGYVSSRGNAPILDFGDALLAGLAADGGLYLPESFPSLTDSAPDTYVELAAAVMAPYVDGVIDERAFKVTLREKLVKIGAKVVRHGRYVTFQLAEVAVPRSLFEKILSLIDDLRRRPIPA